MIVYAVFSGSYSSRGLDAIFSTKEKAQDYIDQIKKYGHRWHDVDDEPTEYELDKQDKLEIVHFMFCDGKIEICSSYWNDYEVIEEDGKVIVPVKYNIDYNVMEKSAIDLYNTYKAIREHVV